MDYFDLLLPLSILTYVLPVAFVCWFLISFIKVQKERNSILRDISMKLDNKRKEE
ncbi:hypothetical protein [Bacillus sp. KH172YL63]|uniref:hypothetical protein n=1 Tax=Bacillus sp. KH172YL63 TaxID=2709784 RepID=UPI0013E4B539|nr:hypothetical protein [Bacillus sp. KH172YL63]BCB03994.1 hypothetical protein KH172YL63_21270 [Bacillus sp. KH172YL63]